MKILRRIFGIFLDSPTYGRDRANLVSGFTVGMAALFLNGAVLMLMLPILLNPDDRDFRTITENVEFGQLLSLILLGGATAFATVLIPLRLVTVFWGPRIGRYFDQIVLSGITPFRFVIGKATSQNLFLCLILFLLLPYFVLSLALGGVHLGSFLACLFLVWLYCIALALATLWASLYLNELLAAILVISGASIFAGLGFIPLPIQPFVMTPTPALIQPVFASIPSLNGMTPVSMVPIFFSCVACMSLVICISLLAIYLGPLFGIIRENSTFGEVVRPGDSKRKRWFRLRLHIQRPSEIAFFYENRGDSFRRNEGLIRWGLCFFGLVLVMGVGYFVFIFFTKTWLARWGGAQSRWWVYEFHTFYLTIHGLGLVLGMFIFSHSRNSTYLRIPFVRGRKVEVSRLDTRAFVLFLLLCTIAAIAAPFQFERLYALPSGNTIFPEYMYSFLRGRTVDYLRIAVEGTAVISVGGLVIYTCHRYVCLMTWLRSLSLLGVAGAYFIIVCLLPMFLMVLFFEVPELRNIQIFQDWAPTFAMVSPITVIIFLFNEMGSRFPIDISTVPFYVVHGVILGVTLFAIHRRGRQVREMYLKTPQRKTDSKPDLPQNDSQDPGSQDPGSQDPGSQDPGSQENDSQENDSQENDSQENDSRGNDRPESGSSGDSVKRG